MAAVAADPDTVYQALIEGAESEYVFAFVQQRCHIDGEISVGAAICRGGNLRDKIAVRPERILDRCVYQAAIQDAQS